MHMFIVVVWSLEIWGIYRLSISTDSLALWKEKLELASAEKISCKTLIPTGADLHPQQLLWFHIEHENYWLSEKEIRAITLHTATSVLVSLFLPFFWLPPCSCSSAFFWARIKALLARGLISRTFRGGITYGSRGRSPKGCSLSANILNFRSLS